MKRRYAVMGRPVGHSLSPIIHALFARQLGYSLTYEKIEIHPTLFHEQVTQFFNEGGHGLNITLPCKEQAFALADQVTSRCFIAKAANTLWRNAAGLQADNTDGVGLLRDLAHYIDLAGKRILVVGAGGAARGILAPLLTANLAQLTVANRTPEKAYTLLQAFRKLISQQTAFTCCALSELSQAYDLVINATSASFSEQRLDLPNVLLTPTTLCYDLAYDIKSPTPFVAWAQSHGCVALDGLGMLVEQAAEAFFIWHGVMPDVMPVLAHFR